MGQHKGTAFACRDWSLAKSDLISDLMDGWDGYADMANGASSVDRQNAKDALNELSQEWDGTYMPAEELDAFANEYDAELRAAARRYQAPCTVHYSALGISMQPPEADAEGFLEYRANYDEADPSSWTPSEQLISKMDNQISEFRGR